MFRISGTHMHHQGRICVAKMTHMHHRPDGIAEKILSVPVPTRLLFSVEWFPWRWQHWPQNNASYTFLDQIDFLTQTMAGSEPEGRVIH